MLRDNVKSNKCMWMCRRVENLSENFHSCWITEKTGNFTWIVKLPWFNFSCWIKHSNLFYSMLNEKKTFDYHDIMMCNCSLSWPVVELTRYSFRTLQNDSILSVFKRLAKYVFPYDPSTITWPINCPLTHSSSIHLITLQMMMMMLPMDNRNNNF